MADLADVEIPYPDGDAKTYLYEMTKRRIFIS